MKKQLYHFEVDMDVTPAWLLKLSQKAGLITVLSKSIDGLLAVKITLPPAVGSGGVLFIQLNPHLSVLFSDVLLHVPVHVVLKNTGKNLLVLHFPLMGNIISPEFYIEKGNEDDFADRQLILSDCSTEIFCDPGKSGHLSSLKIITRKEHALEHALSGTDTVFNRVAMDMRSVNVLEELAGNRIEDESFGLYLRGAAYLLLANFHENWRLQQTLSQRWHTEDIRLIIKTRQYLLKQLEDGFPGIAKLAAMANMSISKYKLLFTDLNGAPPKKFFTMKQLELARKMLSSGEFKVLDVVYKLGYSNPGFFSHQFKKVFGMPPKKVFAARTNCRHTASVY